MMTRSKVENNLYKQVEERQYVELLNGGGYFSKFAYESDPYDRFLDQQREEKRNQQLKQRLVHEDKPFVNMPVKEAMHKHQNPFNSYLW